MHEGMLQDGFRQRFPRLLRELKHTKKISKITVHPAICMKTKRHHQLTDCKPTRCPPIHGIGNARVTKPLREIKHTKKISNLTVHPAICMKTKERQTG